MPLQPCSGHTAIVECLDVIQLLSMPQAIREMAVRGSTGRRLVTRSIPDWRSYWSSACYSVLVNQAGCNGRVTSPPLLLLLPGDAVRGSTGKRRVPRLVPDRRTLLVDRPLFRPNKPGPGCQAGCNGRVTFCCTRTPEKAYFTIVHGDH